MPERGGSRHVPKTLPDFQQHLQAYLNEYVFRFNRRFWPMVAFDSMLGIAVHAAAPTYAGLY